MWPTGAVLEPSGLLTLFTSFRAVLTQGSFCYPRLAGPTLLLLAESQGDAHQQGEGWRGWLQGTPGWLQDPWVASEGETTPGKFCFASPFF